MSFQEMAIEIRAVDHYVTDGARLILRGLIVEIRRTGGRAKRGGRVALQAENIEITGLEQMRIWRSMR